VCRLTTWALAWGLGVGSGFSAEVIVDNDAGVPAYTETGAWTQSGTPGYNSGVYRFASAGAAATAVWTADLPAADDYDVAVWYRDGSNRSGSVRYVIETAGGPEVVTVDQRGNGLAFESLGTFAFNAGSTTITLDAAGSGTPGVVISDAVRFTQGGPPPPPPPTILQTQTVEPGIVYTEYLLPDPVHVHVLEFDLAEPDLTLDMGFALGKRNYGSSRERTSAIAARYDTPGHEVIAAINAAFYGTGLEVRGGTWAAAGNLVTRPDYTSAHDVWATLDNEETWVARRPFFPATTDMTVHFANGTELELDWLNYTAGAGEYAIYTRDWDLRTGITTNGVELLVSGVNFPLRPEKVMQGTIAQIRTGAQTQDSPIPFEGFTLRATDASDTVLTANATIGDPISFEVELGSPILNNVKFLQHARGILVDDGVVSPESWIYGDSFARHPRTVIASKGTTHYFVVFDGRSTASIGVNVEHMADFLVNVLEVDRAANVDGGGSSTLWVDGTILNVPSDGAERAVVNAILLVREVDALALPAVDSFPESGRELDWEDKHSYNPVVSFSPTAPGGDGFALEVLNEDEGVETVVIGGLSNRDMDFSVDLFCDHRPEDAVNGFERIGIVARDDGIGAFDSGSDGGGNCLALTHDSDSGEVRAWSITDGVMTDVTSQPVSLTDDGWYRFRILCQGDRVVFSVDDTAVAEIMDTARSHGQVGIAHSDHFATGGLARGAHADNASLVSAWGNGVQHH
jgi:hypothetical protein